MTSNKKKFDKPIWLKKLLLLLAIIGPGIITANIDNDAGGIATYSIAGASTGYRLLWLLIPITITLIMVQEMSARMGIVSRKGLADLIREKYGLRITFHALIFLIIADLGNTMAEFAGIASAGEIFGISKYISVPLCSLMIWLLVIKGSYKIVERVLIFGCSVFLAYIVSGLMSGADWNHVMKSLVTPNISDITRSDLPIIVGLVGTSITPWMQFYIQSAVVEKGINVKNIKYNKVDIIIGCLLMFLVSLFIIVCCAAGIYESGVPIKTAGDAALALMPLAGHYSSILFAFGLFNASFLAAALLPMAASYYVCEGMGWESGVNKTLREAPKFFSIFTILIVLGAGLTLIPNIGLLNIMIWSQIINGILIPLILLFIINLCNDREVMGIYVNSTAYNIFSYLIVAAMFTTNIYMIYNEIIRL